MAQHLPFEARGGITKLHFPCWRQIHRQWALAATKGPSHETQLTALVRAFPLQGAQRGGCETLRVLVQGEECRTQAMAAGVLSSLVAAMSAHELSEGIQVAATEAIRILVASTAQRNGFASSGAVQAVRGNPTASPANCVSRCVGLRWQHASSDAQQDSVSTAADFLGSQVINGMKNRPSNVRLAEEGTQAALAFARDKDCRAKVRIARQPKRRCHLCTLQQNISCKRATASVCFNIASHPLLPLRSFSQVGAWLRLLRLCAITRRRPLCRRLGARLSGGSCSAPTGARPSSPSSLVPPTAKKCAVLSCRIRGGRTEYVLTHGLGSPSRPSSVRLWMAPQPPPRYVPCYPHLPPCSTSFTARELALEKNGLRDVMMGTIRAHIQNQSKGSFDLICGGPAGIVLAQMKAEARGPRCRGHNCLV